MANHLLSIFLLLSVSVAFAQESAGDDFLQSQETVPPQPKKMKAMREKLSHFRFYWHDVVAGSHPTSVMVAQAPITNASATAFGLVRVIDNALTVGPAPDSRLVGRAQGFYASAAQETVGLMMAMNFAFTDGKYNGSTVTVLGRNEVFTGVREMPVLGGSGLFRFARGYVQARTHSSEPKTGNAVVKYDCFVLHY